MTGRKKTSKRIKSGGRKKEGGRIKRTPMTLEEELLYMSGDVLTGGPPPQWRPAPDSKNAMHQIKTIQEEYQIEIAKWRGEYVNDKRQSGFMVIRDWDVLYQGPDQEKAWQVFRSELSHRKSIVDRAIAEAKEIGFLGDDPDLPIKVELLLTNKKFSEAARTLEGYAESFEDEDIMPDVRKVARELNQIASAAEADYEGEEMELFPYEERARHIPKERGSFYEEDDEDDW